MMQILIVKSKNLNYGQKKIHSILLWTVPFIWGVLIITTVRLSTKDSKKTRDKINHDSEYKDNVANLTMWVDQNDH